MGMILWKYSSSIGYVSIMTMSYVQSQRWQKQSMMDKNYGALFREMIPQSIQFKGNKKSILEQVAEFLPL
jgi:hypothetical protein